MRNIIRFFIQRPIWTNAFIAMVLMFGLFSLFNLKKSFFPELDPNKIIITVFYPGASPQEMEDGVTIKIEQAVKGLKDIEHIDATSLENFSQVSIKAYVDADMDELLTDVENSVNSINSFPQGAEKPMIVRRKATEMSSTVAFVGVTSKDPSISKTDLAKKTIQVENDLLNTKVITQISKQGFPETEISVNVRESDLLRYNIGIAEISQAIQLKNNDVTAGMIRGGIQEMNIRANNRGTSVEDISNITVRSTSSGENIKVGDVADVVLGFSDGSEKARYNNKPSISMQINKTTEEDIAEISDAIHAYEKKFNEENEQYSFEVFFEFNSMLNQRIELLNENGIFGLILVLICLGLFLNAKLSAWVAFGIPFSFLGMFILGSFYGMTINMISLFGMILVVGILVDDGIVIAENIYSHFEKGKSAPKAALDGTMEVLPSVFTSVLTTMVAFSMLLFIEGLEMMREMAFVVIACLGFSLFEAFFILPSHLASKTILTENKETPISVLKGLLMMLVSLAVIYGALYLLPDDGSFGASLPVYLLIIGCVMLLYKGYSSSPIEKKVRAATDRFIRYARDVVFGDIVGFLLKKKWIYRVAVFVPLLFIIVTFGLMGSNKIGFTFFPDIPPDFFNIEVAFNPGDPEEKTDEFIATATSILNEERQKIIDESGDSLVSYYTSNVGMTMNLGQTGSHTGGIMVYIDAEGKTTPYDTLKNRIIRRLAQEDIGKIAQDLYVGGFQRFGADVEFGISSPNEKDVDAAREMFKQELNNLGSLQNVKDNMPPGRNEVKLELLPQADVFGIGKPEVVNQIRQGFFGQEAQRLIIGTEEVKVWVRYPKEDRNSLSDLEAMKIKTISGLEVPLTSVANFSIDRGPESLKRRDGNRQVKVDAKAIVPDSVAVINEAIINVIIPKIESLYPSVNFAKLGQVERSQKTGESMKFMTIIVLIVMIIIITLHFSSVYQAFLILSVIPAGVAGAIMGHGIIGIPVSMLSLFGVIALLGVLINDAVVFLDKYNDLVKSGLKSRRAAYEASISRFRPILLTTITTVAGLLPLISEKSMQAQFLIPMAASIAFGVLFGTLFILAFFPVLILFGNDIKRTFIYLWTGKKPSHQDVETALVNDKNINEKLAEIE